MVKINNRKLSHFIDKLKLKLNSLSGEHGASLEIFKDNEVVHKTEVFNIDAFPQQIRSNAKIFSPNYIKVNVLGPDGNLIDTVTTSELHSKQQEKKAVAETEVEAGRNQVQGYDFQNHFPSNMMGSGMQMPQNYTPQPQQHMQVFQPNNAMSGLNGMSTDEVDAKLEKMLKEKEDARELAKLRERVPELEAKIKEMESEHEKEIEELEKDVEKLVKQLKGKELVKAGAEVVGALGFAQPFVDGINGFANAFESKEDAKNRFLNGGTADEITNQNQTEVEEEDIVVAGQDQLQGQQGNQNSEITAMRNLLIEHINEANNEELAHYYFLFSNLHRVNGIKVLVSLLQCTPENMNADELLPLMQEAVRYYANLLSNQNNTEEDE